MSLRINFWNKVNAKQGAKDVQYRTVLQSLQAIHPDSVLLLRNSSDEPWLGQLIKRGQLFSKNRIKVFQVVAKGAIKTPVAYGSWSKA